MIKDLFNVLAKEPAVRKSFLTAGMAWAGLGSMSLYSSEPLVLGGLLVIAANTTYNTWRSFKYDRSPHPHS